MTLVVSHPPGLLPERRYALQVVLGEFLGLAHEAVEADVEDVEIRLPQAAGAVVVGDVLFRRWRDGGRGPHLLPDLPLLSAEVAGSPVESAALPGPLPLLYARGEALPAAPRGDGIELGLDVFGSAFFMLSRLEELLLPDRDAHGRFPAAASAAVRGGFLGRPLVDEYVEVLWAALSRTWPRLERRPRAFRLVPTHDVDWPLCMRGGPARVAADVAADVVRRRDPRLALRRARAAARTLRGEHDADVCNTFDFIMDASERAGVASAFYFLASGPGPAPYDCDYGLDEPWIRGLLARIAGRGHEIGLHGSYEGHRDGGRIGAEAASLAAACEAAGVAPAAMGGRQHYLRWENPATWRAWDEAGLVYDSTLAYAEAPGFRAGVCREYPVFDLERRRPLRLRERPLVLMEVSLTDYLGLRGEELARRAAGLREACRRVAGDFVFLWHNNRLVGGADRAAYLGLLDGA